MIPAAIVAQATPAPPLRHVVFAFTYGQTRNLTLHNSGFVNAGESGASANGIDDYIDHDDASGTISVDVLQVARDKGMLVSVSESADNPVHDALPARCVVYATAVSCQAGAKVNPEEVSIIRLLAVGFVDPARIDANNHWRVDDGGPGAAGSDYTVVANDKGALRIDEQRSLGSGSAASAITGTIDYDLNREIVTGLNETVLGHPRFQGAYIDDHVTLTATLQSDSMAH